MSDELSPPTDELRELSAGGAHVCALTADDSLGCWGENQIGQTMVPDGPFDLLSVRGNHVCGLRSGIAACWGSPDRTARSSRQRHR